MRYAMHTKSAWSKNVRSPYLPTRRSTTPASPTTVSNILVKLSREPEENPEEELQFYDLEVGNREV